MQPCVSPLRGHDVTRDKERDTVRNFSLDATQYAKQAELGELMTEMLTGTLLQKPEKPIDFLIDLLTVERSKKVAVCGPPGLPLEVVVKALADEHGAIVVSIPPLIDDAKDRIIDGKTVEEHGADDAQIPDHIMAKLVSERLGQPDCVQKGWILEDFPTSKGQAQRLVAAGYLPDKVILIRSKDDLIVKQMKIEEGCEGDAEAIRRRLVDRIALYNKRMVEMTPLFSTALEEFSCLGPSDLSSVIPAVSRTLQKKETDPGLSKKPGLC